MTLSGALDVRQLTVAVRVDAPAVSSRLHELLCRESIGEIIEVPSTAELRAAHGFDVLLVGGASRRSELLEAYKVACDACPDIPVVGVWPDRERLDSRLALRSGVDGVVLEGSLDTSLAASLEAVVAGRVCFPRTAVAPDHASMLTSREKQVLAMLIMGFTNAEIGRRLYLAESTVKSHLSSAYLKLGVRSRKDAAAIILDPDEGLGTGILAIESN